MSGDGGRPISPYEISRRAFLAGLAGTAAAAALGGCDRGDSLASLTNTTLPPQPPTLELPPTPRPTVRMAGEDIGVPSPFGYTFPTGYFVMTYIYDSLLWPDVTGTLIPWLATAMPERSADGMTYTFHLREGLRWHDGRPLTASDVAFTFEYFESKKGGLSQFLLFRPKHVARVRALDPLRVEFTLDKPVANFLDQVAGHVPIVPRHIWEPIGDPSVQDVNLLVGSGPYRLEAYGRGRGSYLFTANDDFFLGRPFVKRLELSMVADAPAALLAGDLDVGGPGLPPTAAALEPLRRNPGFGVVVGPPDLLFALYWNLNEPGALSDVRFRQACAYAIDRKNIVKRVGGGLGEVGNPGFLPEGHPFRVEVQQYGHDRDKANQLLDEAGYRKGDKGLRRNPDGSPLRLRLLTQPVVPAVAELVQADLEEVGIDVRLRPIQFIPLNQEGIEFHMAIVIHGGHAGDPDQMRQVYSSRAERTFFSTHGYRSTEFEDLADAQLVAVDEAERKSLVARMQQVVATDLPLLHLFYPANVVAHRKSVLDRVALNRGGLGPSNKQYLVTGSVTGGTDIRPTTP